MTSVVNPPAPLPFLLPRPRLPLLIRGILGSEWDAATWPAAKDALHKLEAGEPMRGVRAARRCLNTDSRLCENRRPMSEIPREYATLARGARKQASAVI